MQSVARSDMDSFKLSQLRARAVCGSVSFIFFISHPLMCICSVEKRAWKSETKSSRGSFSSSDVRIVRTLMKDFGRTRFQKISIFSSVQIFLRRVFISPTKNPIPRDLFSVNRSWKRNENMISELPRGKLVMKKCHGGKKNPKSAKLKELIKTEEVRPDQHTYY